MDIGLAFLNVETAVDLEGLMEICLRLDPLIMVVPARNGMRTGVVREECAIITPRFFPETLGERTFIAKLARL